MSEDPRTLIAEANRVAEDCETYLEAAVSSVVDISTRRKKIQEHIDAAANAHSEAHENLWHLIENEDAGKAEIREAERADERAHTSLYQAHQALGRDYLDLENRKAVARQLAGLIREDSEKRLRAIAARSDDPELQRTVSEAKEEVSNSSRYVLRRFAEARPLMTDEVRKARTEAHEILEHLRNPPVDE